MGTLLTLADTQTNS